MTLRAGIPAPLSRRPVSAAILGLALTLCGEAAATPVARSGNYDSLTLAVHGQAVAGVFAEGRGKVRPGGAPQFSCIFVLRAALAGSVAEVETWFPGKAERIRGTLAFTPDGASLTLAEDHGGCAMTTGSMIGQPYALTRTPRQPAEGWVGVGLVTARRAVLRPEPGPARTRAPYLVQHDPVAMLERRKGWVRAAYRGGKTPAAGWLARDDLAVIEP